MTYKYDYDWASSGNKFPHWESLIHEHKIKRVLELGSWEGMSAVFWAQHVDEVCCVDNWLQPQNDRWNMTKVESHFDHNISFHNNIIKIKGNTSEVLSMMQETHKSYFDMVYIDADHGFRSVITDTVLSYDLVKPGGILLYDDANYFDSVDMALIVIEKMYSALKEIPSTHYQKAYQKI